MFYMFFKFQSLSSWPPGVRSRTFGQDEQSELDAHIAFVDGKYAVEVSVVIL